ncbi:MAG: NIPSNAP family protein [Jiangellaceae bacterium]
MTNQTDDAVLEIRTYRLRRGTGAQFDRLFRERARPMLDLHGIDVVWHGPSMDDADSYTLMRAFRSAEARDREESAFYGSDEWRDGPREPILALIETYHTIVLPAEPSTIDGLRRISPAPGRSR